MGYVVTRADGGCELQQIDLDHRRPHRPGGRGQPRGLRHRHRRRPVGTVYGITDDYVLDIGSQDFAPSAINGPSLVTYAADGTPSMMPIDTGRQRLHRQRRHRRRRRRHGLRPHRGQHPGLRHRHHPSTSLGPLYEGDSVCLFTVDPATGAATVVGHDRPVRDRVLPRSTACASGLRSTYFGDESLVWATESSTTGAVTDAADADFFPTGLRLPEHRQHPLRHDRRRDGPT